MVKSKERMKVKEGGEILSLLSSSGPGAGLRGTFPMCALSLSRVESRREGAGHRGRGSGGKLSVSVSQSRQGSSKAVYLELKAVGPTSETYNCGLCTSLLQFLWLTLRRSLSHWLILGKDSLDCSLS